MPSRDTTHTSRVIGASSIVAKLGLTAAAKQVTTKSLTDLPRLISDRALEDAQAELASQTRAELLAGLVPSVEFIPMPKQGFGNRPLAALSPQSRVALEALVSMLQNSLPVNSRDAGFESFERYGIDQPESWLIDFDIAACYEFVDHIRLSAELILQGGDSAAVELTQATLSAVFGRQVGLPQGVDSSHRLSDAYLDVIERSLVRRGYTVSRYADDFRVVASSRKEAFRIIESAMEDARRVHLTLAEQKIHVRKASDVANEIEERSGLMDEYVTRVYGDLADTVVVTSKYDDWDLDFIEPNQDQVDLAAIVELLTDWGNPEEDRSRATSYAGAVALSAASKLSARIPNSILSNIVDKEPVRLRKVMEYLLTRTAAADNWDLLNQISRQARSTPWHKIWLLSTASGIADSPGAEKGEFLEYALKQLDDDHETVRLEAAWLLAVHNSLDSGQLQRLYFLATGTTQIGLAAVAGRTSAVQGSSVHRAIGDDSSLNKRAFAWGFSYAPTS